LKALVVGARGQLGRSLLDLLGAEAEAAPGREGLDLRQPAAVAEAVQASAAGVVFNAAAYNAVDAAEADPDGAFAVNASGALHLARACREAGALLVHVSTDYVFDGTDTRPVPEERCPRPLGVYGASKLAGEALVAAAGAAHLIVRTSGVFARGGSRDKGGSFVERILARAQAGQPLRVVEDQVFAPTYAPDLAAALVALVRADARGLFHVTNDGSCSWHALAVAALRLAGVEAPVAAISARELNAPAPRPAYSVLDCGRYRALGLPPLRPWPDALAALVEPWRFGGEATKSR
jgi:dTDP-4-dehydrorhamnose reductase